jgi:glycosyltransferase involved in cell wall biosynthesis
MTGSSSAAPTLSVVLPVRDVEPYVGTTLASLELNHAPGLEVVVVDDGSVDRTPELVADFARRVPGVRVLRNETAVGLGEARNQGLAASSGRYVTYLDGDDWLARGHLAALVGAIEELRVDFVRIDHVQATGRKRVVRRAPEHRRDTVLDARDGILPLGEDSMVDYPFAWAGVYDRRLADAGLLTFPGRLHTAEDRPWIWRLHLHAATFAVVSLHGYFYRRNVRTSLTHVGDARQLQFLDAFDLVLAEVLADRDADRFLPKAVRTYCAIIVHQVRVSDRLSQPLRQELRRRAGEALRGMPPDLLEPTMAAMGRDREAVLRGLARSAPGSSRSRR